MLTDFNFIIFSIFFSFTSSTLFSDQGYLVNSVFLCVLQSYNKGETFISGGFVISYQPFWIFLTAPFWIFEL
jgi:hypothetical protein